MIERLKEGGTWFPYPAILAFGLALICVDQSLLNLNPRIGNPSNPLVFKASPEKEGSIWFSLSLLDNKIVVMSDERKIFTWDKQFEGNYTGGIKKFEEYIKERVERVILSSSLINSANKTESLVVISVDRNIKFIHFKPILYILATAGVDTYAFETKQLLLSQKD